MQVEAVFKPTRDDGGCLATVSMQVGECGLPFYSGALGALAALPGAFVLRRSRQVIPFWMIVVKAQG